MSVITHAWVRDKPLGARASLNLVYWATPAECGSLSNTTTTYVLTFFIHAEIKMCLSCAVLTRLPLVPHICASELGQHWSRQWLVTSSVPSCYLNQHWFIVTWTLRTKLQGNLNRNTLFFVHGKAFENIDCEIEGTFFPAEMNKRGNLIILSFTNSIVVELWCDV